MTLIVPKKKKGLAKLEASLSQKALDGWLAKLDTKVRVNVRLPKWKTESTEELSDALKKLGLEAIFAGEGLGGISKEEGLAISGVVSFPDGSPAAGVEITVGPDFTQNLSGRSLLRTASGPPAFPCTQCIPRYLGAYQCVLVKPGVLYTAYY